MKRSKGIILENRTWKVQNKNGERTTWYTPLKFMREFKSVTRAEHFNTTSSCGDWDGLLVQNINKRWYVIPFYQKNMFGYFLLTTSQTFVKFHTCPSSEELCEVYNVLQLMYA